jgi:ABC-type transporter Mla maintaining outer membrane lipid asymmetry ATPase subunit MlaF
MIELRDLALTAPDGHLLLDGLNLTIPQGGSQLVTGSSGCGKSRLLKVVAGTERPARGRVTVAGRDLWPGDGVISLAERVTVGFVFASGGLLSNLSLRDNIGLPLRFRGLLPDDLRDRVDSAMERVGLLPVADLRPHAVSAAARKHGNLARVLALEPELILLDDPLEGLDLADRSTALEVIRHWIVDPAKTLMIAQEDAAPFADLVTSHLDLHVHPIPLETP